MNFSFQINKDRDGQRVHFNIQLITYWVKVND